MHFLNIIRYSVVKVTKLWRDKDILEKILGPQTPYLCVSLMKGIVLLLQLCFSLLKSADCEKKKEIHTLTQGTDGKNAPSNCSTDYE